MQEKMKRITTLLLAFVMAMAMIPNLGGMQAHAAGGTPVQDGDVYLIQDAADFAAMQADGNYKLDADITVTTPYASDFSGTFDGNGHTVTLDISGAANTALFKNLTAGATIKNVITDGTVTATGNYSAALAGKATGGTDSSTKVTIESCINKATVNGAANLGGLIGWAINIVTIKNCSNVGNVTSTSGNRIGGIIAYTSGNASDIAIEGCANTAEVKGASNQIGGIVGNIYAGKCTIQDCYNAGAVTGTGEYSNMLGGIVGQATKSGPTDSLINCYNAGTVSFSQSINTSIGSILGNKSNNGTTMNCYALDTSAAHLIGGVSSPTGVSKKTSDEMKDSSFVSLLGVAFTRDTGNINNGYPILKWQQTEDVTPVEVASVEITGSAVTGATLKAVPKSAGTDEPTNVKYQWTVDGADIEGATTPTFIVPDEKASKGKKYSVTVTGDNDSSATSSEFEITELSDALKVSLDKEAATITGADRITETGSLGLAATGENGSTITWASANTEYISDDGNVAKLPETGKVEVTMTATIASGEVSDTKAIKCTVYSEDAAQAKAQIAKEKFDAEYALRPAFKTDKNIVDMVQKKVDGYVGENQVTVALKSSGDTDIIASDGKINYNTKELNQYGMNSSNVAVEFTFTYDGESVDTKSKNATIGWDIDHYNAKMAAEAELIAFDNIKGENTSASEITTDFTLPQIVTSSARTAWSKVTWTSSDSDVISIEATGYDSVTDPKKGKVTQYGEDKVVTLTATFNANDSNINTNVEKVEDFESVVKTFTVTVKAKPVPTEAELLDILNKYYTNDLLTDFVTKEKLNLNAVDGDIQLPRYTTIKDENSQLVFANKEIEVSSDSDAAVVSGYKVNIDPFKGGDINLTIKFTREGVTASKTIPIKIVTLSDEVLDKEIAMMDVAKEHYYDGINDKQYDDQDAVFGNLHPFQEMTLDDNGNPVWAYNMTDKTGRGIIPDGYWEEGQSEEMEGSGYNRFKSSDPNTIQHENLVVNRSEESKQVTVTSWLSSELYGKYAKKYPENEKLQKLYKQEVSATVTVVGTANQKESLAAKIQEAEAMVAEIKEGTDAGEYEPGTQADLRTAIDAAKAVYNDDAAADKDIVSQLNKLGKAVEAAKVRINPSKAKIVISVSNFEKYNKFDFVPQEIEVSSDAAEKYGEIRDIDAGNAGKVTFADLIFTVHALKFGDAFTEDTVSDYIQLGPTGYFSKCMGVSTYNISYLINEDLTMSGGAFIIVLEDGDEAALYKYQDEANFSDLYTHFVPREITVRSGEEVALQIEGLGWTHPLGPVAKYDTEDVKAATYNEAGEVKPIDGAEMDSDGTIKFSLSDPGNYDVTAFGKVNGAYTDYSDWENPTIVSGIAVPIVLPYAKVTVLDADDTAKEAIKEAEDSVAATEELNKEAGAAAKMAEESKKAADEAAKTPGQSAVDAAKKAQTDAETAAMKAHEAKKASDAAVAAAEKAVKEAKTDQEKAGAEAVLQAAKSVQKNANDAKAAVDKLVVDAKKAVVAAENAKSEKDNSDNEQPNTPSVTLDPDKITPSDDAVNAAKVDKKLAIKASGITTSAKTGKKTMTVKWKKVAGATNYRIAYKKAGAKKWTYKWSKGKNSVVLTKMKKNGLYEFKLQAVKKSGSTWTKSSFTKSNYRFYAKTTQKVKAGKKSVTVKAKKIKGATGYEVLYSTKSTMKGYKVKKGKKTSIKVTGLKKGAKYYTQVRPVKKYNGKTYIGVLSSKKGVRVR